MFPLFFFMITSILLFSAWLNTFATDLHESPSKLNHYYNSNEPVPSYDSWKNTFSSRNFETLGDRKVLTNYERELKQAFNLLPPEHTKNLESLEIRNQFHKSRGLANHRKIILNIGNIDTREELVSVFIHEVGHIVDLGHFKSSSKQFPSPFKDGNQIIYKDDTSRLFYQISWQNTSSRKPQAKDKSFVSQYAMQDPFEDFAETYLYYRIHGEKFRSKSENSFMLRQKYWFMKQYVFDGKEFQTEKFQPEETETVYDSTLIEYDLKAFLSQS